MAIVLFSTAILLFAFQNVKYLLLFWISLMSITLTAKTANLYLVTRNTEDFKKVEVQITNPFD